MLGTGRMFTSEQVVRCLKMAAVVCLGACQPNCDDPTGPDVQASVGGRVTLNGEPLEGVELGAGDRTTTTSATGSYSLTIQGEDFPLITCVTLRSPPYPAIVEATFSLTGCPLILNDEGGISLHWAFAHVPPTIQITSPADGGQIGNQSAALNWTVGGSVALNGQTAPIRPPTRWSSSIDGPLGEGQFGIFIADLSLGTHTLTASFTDLFDVTVTDQVDVDVVDLTNQAPTATITSPESGLAYPNGSTLDLAGAGSDPEDGALTGASLAWTSSQEGSIGNGESFSRIMAEGSHVIVLTATDSQGASGTDTILIHINAPAGGAGTIQGAVTIGGTPLADVPVVLTGTASANTVTNAQGAYSFPDLGPGNYTITITPPPGTDIGIEQMVTLADGQTLTVNFVG